jgi:gluconate 5-dehydrogenase
MNKLFSIKDKVIVITGATGHLGSKMADHLSLIGAKVIILSRTQSKAINLCRKLGIDESHAVGIDISSKKSINAAFKYIYNNFSAIDVLVNNAYFGASKKFSEYSKEDWYTSFDGSVVSIDMVTQTVLPYMKSGKSGRIINIASMYGMISPNPDVYLTESMINPLSYGVGKAAIIQYTKYLAMTLGENNITVNSISYGAFPNANKPENTELFLQNLSKKTFVKRIGSPEDATSAVFFLSLDESSYVTGQNIVVDGGWTSW